MIDQGELPRETIEDEDTEGKSMDSEEDRAKRKTTTKRKIDHPRKREWMFSLPELKGNRQEWELPDELKEFFDERCKNHLSV